MNKKVLGIVIVLAVVVGVAWTQIPEPAPETEVAAALVGQSGTVLITYTDKGFIPAVVSVTGGSSLKIMNTSNSALLVAPFLDQGKDAAGYQVFTASKSVGRGESFDISVNAQGIWAYKNANAPGTVGVVIVE